MSKVTSSTLKKCWLMRFTKLQIDSGGPSTSETPQEEKTIRNRSGVFRSLRKMRKRVKSCITHNKLGDSTKEETLLSYVSTLKKITKARNQMSQVHIYNRKIMDLISSIINFSKNILNVNFSYLQNQRPATSLPKKSPIYLRVAGIGVP